MKNKKKRDTYPLRIFCSNCYGSSVLRFKYGTEVLVAGTNITGLSEYTGGTSNSSPVQCPKCGSRKINKIVPKV